MKSELSKATKPLTRKINHIESELEKVKKNRDALDRKCMKIESKCKIAEAKAKASSELSSSLKQQLKTMTSDKSKKDAHERNLELEHAKGKERRLAEATKTSNKRKLKEDESRQKQAKRDRDAKILKAAKGNSSRSNKSVYEDSLAKFRHRGGEDDKKGTTHSRRFIHEDDRRVERRPYESDRFVRKDMAYDRHEYRRERKSPSYDRDVYALERAHLYDRHEYRRGRRSPSYDRDIYLQERATSHRCNRYARSNQHDVIYHDSYKNKGGRETPPTHGHNRFVMRDAAYDGNMHEDGFTSDEAYDGDSYEDGGGKQTPPKRTHNQNEFDLTCNDERSDESKSVSASSKSSSADNKQSSPV